MKNNRDFACNVFDRAKMKKYLAPWAFEEICQAQNNLETSSQSAISPKCAENFAKGLQKWAISRGATRFTHWFQPLNNFTAGKRDSLFSVDENGAATMKFRGKELRSGEGDASSFPSGGLRQTFEARGITDWDIYSQPFVSEGCLFVPTTFKSFGGDALDKKTPLLRSMCALNRETLRLMKLIGFVYKKAVSVVGAEQEYFLVEKQQFLQRPDLFFAGRTLVGAPSPKGQELFDHYYRPPTQRILDFWREVDKELWTLGIIAKTEHREVAPNQFELAPCYAAVNVACDQNQIVMHVLQTVAEKQGLVCLLHEKPYQNFNGSGKHNNWSLLADETVNLFEQGKTASEQARFVLLLACVVRAADLHQDLLRFAVASASNDCRLGGFEAPPQTVSVFLGNIFESLTAALDGDWQMGFEKLPQNCALTDRNRTSPFAFTGNKFEFRTVGSSASLADCNTVLNTVMAESLHYFADEAENLRASSATPQQFWEKIKQLVATSLKEHGKIVFCGNNYSAEWKAEAQKRGLLNIPDSFLAAKCLSDEKNIALFDNLKVLTPREIAAQQQIFWETYADTICVEANVCAVCLRKICQPMQKHLNLLLQLAEEKRMLNINCENDVQQAQKAAQLVDDLQKYTEILHKNATQFKQLADAEQKARFAAETLLPLLSAARKTADEAENVCPSELYPMPKYEELLFTL